MTAEPQVRARFGWRVAAAFAAVFLFGAAVGAVCVLRYARPALLRREPPAPEQFSVQLMRRWVQSDKLALTAEQREKVRPIVLETAESLRRLRRDALHSGQLEIERMQDQVAAILTPEQKARFEELIQAARDRMRRYIQQQQ